MGFKLARESSLISFDRLRQKALRVGEAFDWSAGCAWHVLASFLSVADLWCELEVGITTERLDDNPINWQRSFSKKLYLKKTH